MTKLGAAFTSATVTEGWREPQVIRVIESADTLGRLRSGRAHRRSLGFAPTARRGRRDDKLEGGDHLGRGEADGQSQALRVWHSRRKAAHGDYRLCLGASAGIS
jgi:hypothetical protein